MKIGEDLTENQKQSEEIVCTNHRKVEKESSSLREGGQTIL